MAASLDGRDVGIFDLFLTDGAGHAATTDQLRHFLYIIVFEDLD